LRSNFTKNGATKAAQRESLPNITKILLPNLTNILLSKPSREIAAESYQNNWYEICPKIIAAESHQNIAVKAVQRKCCQISLKYCCRSSIKYCCQSRPEKLRSNFTRNGATKAAQRESLPNITKILLSKPSGENASESHQNIAAESHQNVAIKAVQRIAAKYQQYIATRAAQR
jgi:hypothetical protein